jgi:hypothetical protein
MMRAMWSDLSLVKGLEILHAQTQGETPLGDDRRGRLTFMG